MREFKNLRFLTNPACRPVLGTIRDVELLEYLHLTWEQPGLGGGTQSLIVPAGFIHDGPSIPTFLRGVVPFTIAKLRPAIAHDYIYVFGCRLGWDKDDGDALFYAGLEAEGVKDPMIWIMYRGVRLGGRGCWDEGGAPKKESLARELRPTFKELGMRIER